MPQLLTPADYISMPWKNNAGTTAEIARDEDQEPYRWRLSLAPVVAAGPFSKFPGYRRFLSIVEGKSLLLKGPAGEKKLLPGDVHHFSGEEVTEASLPDGPVKDIGLIYRPERVKAEMKVIDFPRSRARSFAFRRHSVLFYALAGENVAECYPSGQILGLEQGHCLRVDPEAFEQVISFEPRKPGSKLVIVSLENFL